jgi:hypothetical protein
MARSDLGLPGASARMGWGASTWRGGSQMRQCCEPRARKRSQCGQKNHCLRGGTEMTSFWKA